MRTLPDYPWDLIEPLAQLAAAHPEGRIDLSVGSPVDETPEVIRAALREATDAHSYPATAGSPALRAAIVEWYARRRGVAGLATTQVLPTIGSKEFIATMPGMLGIGPGDAIVFPAHAYPTYEIGALLTGADAVATDDPEAWPANTRLVWLNSPGNPDGRVLDAAQLRRAVERARELGAVLVNDECYAELNWIADEPTVCVLAPEVIGDDPRGVLSVYSLSKQSNLAGYRAGFVAGDPELIQGLLAIRKHSGLIPPAPVQHAMVAALGDESHVTEQRERYRARRDVLKPALEAAGFRIDHSTAGLYLWATEGRPAMETLERLARVGILAGPGTFYGDPESRHVRFALTETDARIADAGTRLAALDQVEVTAV